MDTSITLDPLPSKDQKIIPAIINQLGDCQTLGALNQVLQTTLIPLFNCSGVFYACLEGQRNTLRILGDINQSFLCPHNWQNFLEIAVQTQLLAGPEINKNAPLSTNNFCCTDLNCQQCSTTQAAFQSNHCCAITALFDAPKPTIAIYFCHLKTHQQQFTQRDLILLQLLRATLLQTIKVIILQQQCRSFQQMLDHLSDAAEPLALIRDDGILIYKNAAFEQTVEEKNTVFLSTVLAQTSSTELEHSTQRCIISRLGRRLYKIRLKKIKNTTDTCDFLYLLRFSRVTHEHGQLFRKLSNVGLTDRELEIATLIFQGLPTRHISEQLSLSYHTVRNHIKHIYSKMQVSTRSEMLTWLSK